MSYISDFILSEYTDEDFDHIEPKTKREFFREIYQRICDQFPDDVREQVRKLMDEHSNDIHSSATLSKINEQVQKIHDDIMYQDDRLKTIRKTIKRILK